MEEGLEYGVSLTDQMSGPAKEAQKSVADLGTQLTDARKTLIEYQRQLSLSKDLGDIEGYRKYTALVAEQKRAVFGLTEAVRAMPPGISKADKALADMAARAKAAEASLAEMTKRATKAERTSASLATKAESLATKLKQATTPAAMSTSETLAAVSAELGAVTGGVAIAVAAVGGLALGFGALTVEAASYAIEATQAKQATIGMFSALGGSIAVGRETEEMLGGLSEKTGLTKNALAPLTRSFMAMGIEGTAALERVTLAAASAQAIMGDPAAANAFDTLTRKIQVAVQTGQGLKIPAKGLGSLADMGVRVDDVAARMNISSKALADQLKNGTVNAAAFGDALQTALIEKGAGAVQRMASSLGNIKKRFGQSIEDMFEDMGKAVDPFIAQVRDLFSIFSQSKASGQAMKAGITGALTSVFSAASKVVPYIKHFFLDLVIWSLRGYIFVKKHWTEVGTIMRGVGVAIGLMAIPVALMAAQFAIGSAVVLGAVGAIGAGIAWVIGKLSALGPAAAKAASDFGAGLVNGIKAWAGGVGDAALGLANAAINGIVGPLRIHSPSKVAFDLGTFTGEPFAKGIEAQAAPAMRASERVATAAETGLRGSMPEIRASDFRGAAGGRGGDSGGRMVIGPITINLTAPNGVTNAIELTEIAIATLFERLQLQQGT